MAIEDVYARCVAHARRVCPPDPAISAEDVAHAAFVKCAALLPTLPTDLDRLRLWTRAVNQVATDAHRRAQRVAFLPLADWTPSGDNVEAEALARVELHDLIARAVVDPFARTAIAVALGYSGHEAAALCCCARPTVNTRVLRFRAANERMGA